MSVYKRGAKGVFYMNFTVNGVRVFRSTGKFTKKEARIIEAVERKKLMEEGSLSQKEKAARMKLSEAIEQVFDARWKYNKDGRKSQRNAERIIEFIGDLPISKIDEDEVWLLIKKLEATGIEPATVNRYLAALKTVLRHHKQQWDHIKLKKEKNGRIRVLTKYEELQLVEMLRKSAKYGKRKYYLELADLVEVLVDTGMRLSEALRMEYKDVNFVSNLISIWINKGEKPRSIPMTSRVRVILQERQLYNLMKPFDITIDEAERAWKWVRGKMKLPHDKEFVLHALRHTCASRLVNGGVDLYVVKEWLGHSSIQITERYAHLNPRKLGDAVRFLE
jgi:integrase